MHGSTRKMVEYVVGALTENGVSVHQFDLAVADLGKLAISLVDAATIILGAPTVHVGPHPAIVYAAYLANALRPKVKYASIIGSYGWASRTIDKIVDSIANLKVELIEPVLCKGYPVTEDFIALDRLVNQVVRKHRESGLLQ
jgi:flavorubredoxin